MDSSQLAEDVYRTIGFAVLPLYFDVESDEPASKYTKGLYLKEGMLRVPIFM